MTENSPLQEALLDIIKDEIEKTKGLISSGKCELTSQEFAVLLKRRNLEPHINSIGDAITTLARKKEIKKVTKCYPGRGWVRTITLA